MEDTYAALQKKMNFTLEMACFCTFWAVFLSMSSPEDIEFSAWSGDLVDVEDVLLGSSEYSVRVMGLVLYNAL